MSGRHTGNFTSYVKEATNNSEGHVPFHSISKLLPGELEAARANNVVLCVAQKNKLTKDLSQSEDNLGTLIITNFRLSFKLFNYSTTSDVSYQENSFLGKYDISLSNINKLYQISDKKKRPIGPEYKNSAKVDAIRVICKNFRLLTFDFESSDIGKGKYIADALLRFAFPSQHNHLFLYHFRSDYYNVARSIRLFNQENDWIQELKRCGAVIGPNGWRIQQVERSQWPEITTLPKFFVVPHCLSTSEYIQKCRFFRQNRAAVWVWSLKKASLIRLADLIENVADRTEENIMLECVRKCDVNRKAPRIIELDKVLPSIQDVYHSHTKLMELCTPENDRQFMFQDSRFYNLIEKSCWLIYVSLCLKESKELSKQMRTGETIVLQETEGRDMCCLISCLIQILLDPYARTLLGFQTLVQKEWVSLGHPFCNRMGHINKKDSVEQSPLFLLFLDCTWQLLQQFPDQFEFSETFLTTLWDSVFLPIFDTFQFNCEADKERAEKVILRPVWDWGEQFSDKDIALFSNPLYKKISITEAETSHGPGTSMVPANVTPLVDELKHYLRNEALGVQKTTSFSTNVQNIKIDDMYTQNFFLEPEHLTWNLEIWSQCYFRWVPMLEIKNGGFPQVDLFNRLLVNNVHRIQKSLIENSGDYNDEINDPNNERAEKTGSSFNINSFFPFSSNNANNTELSDILLTNVGLLVDGSLYDTASIALQTNS